jgi:peptide/nickel transport system ATP-binding protein
MSALLEVADLHVRIGNVQAVRGVSFAVARGETLSIVGESGCGKSMTALAVMGLLPEEAERTARRIELAGNDLATMPERQMSDLRGRRMAMVFQEPMTALNPVYTIGDQIEEVLLRHGSFSRREARERALELLARVGISAARERLGQYPHQLSGGLRQRAMIAMALMCRPELLIADEPTTALDVTIQAQILRLLRELQAELRLGILLITHDLGVVARAADRVAVMYAGGFVETGTVREVFRDPIHPYTRGLLRALPVPGRVAAGGRLGAIPGTVPDLAGAIRGCAFRNRCRQALDLCAEDMPEVELSPGRSYRCRLAPGWQ